MYIVNTVVNVHRFVLYLFCYILLRSAMQTHTC